MRSQLYIGGEWRDAEGGKRFAVNNPATGELLAEVADASVADAQNAALAAHRAQPTWAAMAPRQRGEILRRCFALLIERIDPLAELVVRENGKALAEARAEIAYAAEFFRWFSEEAVRIDGELLTAPSGSSRILVLRQPIGVALLITPWNLPAAMATRKIAPALAAGCAVVLKPARETPLTALAIAEICAEAGVPNGALNVVPTTNSGETVSALLTGEYVRALSFTGSTNVGRRLLEQAAQRVVKCSMELGGNAPFIVFDDADLDAAIEGAMIAKTRHNGEACTAANRFYVQSGIAAEFTKRLVIAMQALRVGNGLDPGVQIGPLVNQAARDKVERLVNTAVAAGAKIETGGNSPAGSGYFYPPTVLSAVKPDAAILSEEIFGPVAPIVTFTDENEALRLANSSEYGLASYLYTRDLARGLRVAEKLEAGMVGLNRGLISDPAAPFGGVKQSGIGREGGREGIREFTEIKYIATGW